MTAFDALKIYQDFPILDQVVNDEPLVYLDNAATTQKPQAVLDVLNDYYHTTNANVHRGVHTLAERATSLYEISRERVRQFIHAKSTKEVLFTRGTTTGLNWVARFAEEVLQADDEVLISIMEHHSNLIPCQEQGQNSCMFTSKTASLIWQISEQNSMPRQNLSALPMCLMC